MRYTNPILYGDYSDPDVVRVGEDFYIFPPLLPTYQAFLCCIQRIWCIGN